MLIRVHEHFNHSGVLFDGVCEDGVAGCGVGREILRDPFGLGGGDDFADVLARGEACCEQHRAGEGAGIGGAFDEGADGVGYGRAVHGEFDPQRVERVGVAVTIGERAELLWRGVFGRVGECGKRGGYRFQGGEFVIGQAQFVAQRFAFGDRADGK